MKEFHITIDRLRQIVNYDALTGTFTWLENRPKGPKPVISGQKLTNTAKTICLDGRSYPLTLIAWVHFYGSPPATRLIFKNGDSSDMRIANLSERRRSHSAGKPSAERLCELLDYNPDSGVFTRKVRTTNRIALNDSCTARNSDGYVIIRVDGKKYGAHRLAWLYMTGSWPTGEIDHINGIRDDNRFANLRVTDRTGNTQNTASAYRGDGSPKGIKQAGDKWLARIQVNKKTVMLGKFTTREEASRAYVEAKRKYHGCSF